MTETSEGMMPDQNAEIGAISEVAMSGEEMATLIRDSAGDALSAIPGIEEMIIDLTKVLRTKVLVFVQEDIEFVFSKMRMFDGIPDEEIDNILKIRVQGEQNTRVGAVLAEARPVRQILAILFAGKNGSAEDFAEGELRPSEASLFQLVADELVAGLVETIDIYSTHGVPGAPQTSNKKEFRQFCDGQEFVALEFAAGFEDLEPAKFEFLVPFEFFDLIKLSKVETKDDEPELTEEEIWSSKLNTKVDNLKIPMSVELASMDLSLSRLCQLQVGEKIVVNATKGGLRVYDDTGNKAFIADLEINHRNMGLRVTRAEELEDA